METPFYSRPICMPDKGIDPSVRYVGSCLSLACQDDHGGYHHSREGTGRPRSNTLQNLKLGLVLVFHLVLLILIQKPSLWHILSIILGMGIFFLSIKLYRQPIKLLKDPKNTTLRAMGGYTQVWDGLPWVMDI